MANNRYARLDEFKQGKTITPTALDVVKGKEGTDPKFLDENGNTNRLTFKDLDNDGEIRIYENQYPSFTANLRDCKVSTGKTYKVVFEQVNGAWKWLWSEVAGSEKQVSDKKADLAVTEHGYISFCLNCQFEMISWRQVKHLKCPMCEKDLLRSKSECEMTIQLVDLVADEPAVEAVLENESKK